MTRPLDTLGAAPEDLAAWREASALTVAAVAGVALTADALLLLGAQCVASAALAMDDLGAALDRVGEAAWAMRQAMDGPPPPPRAPVVIHLLDEGEVAPGTMSLPGQN